MFYRKLMVDFVICYVSGIFLAVAFTDITMIPGMDRQAPIGQIVMHVDSLPNSLRSAIANALLARKRSLGALGISDTPDIAPIIGGKNAVEHKYPWYTLVLYFPYDSIYYYLCGGTIYNERTVITAGHCADDVGQVDGYYAIVAGEHDLTVAEGLEQTVLVDDVRLHRGYRRSGAFVVDDDIALLITDEPLDFTTIAVRPVPSLSTRIKDKMALKANNCVAIGFGIYVQTPEMRLLPDILQEYSPVNFVTNRECRNNMRKIEYSATPKMVCSIDENAGTCNGDSGGSIGCYDDDGVFYQVGMNSWAPKPSGRCGEYAHVYTRMSKYLDWIKYYSYRV